MFNIRSINILHIYNSYKHNYWTDLFACQYVHIIYSFIIYIYISLGIYTIVYILLVYVFARLLLREFLAATTLLICSSLGDDEWMKTIHTYVYINVICIYKTNIYSCVYITRWLIEICVYKVHNTSLYGYKWVDDVSLYISSCW